MSTRESAPRGKFGSFARNAAVAVFASVCDEMGGWIAARLHRDDGVVRKRLTINQDPFNHSAI